MLFALLVALGSGVVSFLAPCTLPLLPAYVGVLSGSAAGVPAERQPARLLRGSLLYVGGFSAVFVALGVSAGAVGRVVRHAGGPVQRIGGAIVLALGVALLVEARTGLLARLGSGDRGRTRLARSSSAWAPFLLGVVFATAFTPCVGPFLGTVLALAASKGGLLSGGLLLAMYSLGLGVPFIVTSMALAGAPGLAVRLARRARVVGYVGGAAMVVLGLLLVAGRYGDLSGFLARLVPVSRLTGT